MELRKGALFLFASIYLCTAAIIPSRRASKLNLANDWSQYNYQAPEGPGSYSFGYDVEDPATNNIQFRNEERFANGTVTGSYGYVDPEGTVRIYHYVADALGYRVMEEGGHKLSMLKPVPVPGSPLLAPDIRDRVREPRPAVQPEITYAAHQIHHQRPEEGPLNTRYSTPQQDLLAANQVGNRPPIHWDDPLIDFRSRRRWG